MEFTPTQIARCCWLAGRGATAEEIAADPKVGRAASEVAFMLDRMDLPPCARRDAPLHLRVEIGRQLVDELDRMAAMLGFGRVELAELILRKVLRDDSALAAMIGGAS